MLTRVARKLSNAARLLAGVAAATAICAFAWAQAPAAKPGLANPASVNCVAKGGKLVIQKNPRGSEFGVCLFEDNRQCEEWALMRGECPAGGLRVAGFVTDAARFCAISGGTYRVSANSNRPDEKGSCTLPGGRSCDAVAFFDGTCTRQ